jgi:hypothetical protein
MYREATFLRVVFLAVTPCGLVGRDGVSEKHIACIFTADDGDSVLS